MKKKTNHKELIQATNFIFENFKSKKKEDKIKNTKNSPLLLTKEIKKISKTKKKYNKKYPVKKNNTTSNKKVLILNNIIKFKSNSDALVLTKIKNKKIKFTFLESVVWESNA